MVSRTMTYTDFNGEERTETFRFHLSKAEALEMEAGVSGGLSSMIERITATRDHPSMVALMKEVILKSYGEKSPDGRQFVKSEDLSTQFAQTQAYSDLFIELATNDEAAATFINGLLPQTNGEVLAEALAEAAANKKTE